MAKEKYFLGADLLRDIRAGLTRVDQLSDQSQAAAAGSGEAGGQYSLRLFRGTFATSSWSIGQTCAVTIEGSTNTLAVTNYCNPVAGVTGSTQTLTVIFGRAMGTLTAVEIQQPTCTLSVGGLDLTQLPNYDAGTIQLLGHGASGETNCWGLQWYSVTQCATTAA